MRIVEWKGGKAGVVRNGYLPARNLQTGLVPMTVQIPKIRAKSGKPATFRLELKLKAREMNVPELAIGDGAMGF